MTNDEEIAKLRGAMSVIADSIAIALEKENDSPMSSGSHLAEAHNIAASYSIPQKGLRYLFWQENSHIGFAKGIEAAAKLVENTGAYKLSEAIRKIKTQDLENEI